MIDAHKTRFGGLFFAVRRYLQFEWFGWTFYRAHLAQVTTATWNQDLRPLRFLLAAISLSIGVFFIFPGRVFDNLGYFYLRQWIDEDVFGALFMLHGVGMLWRGYAPRRINAWGYFFGALGITLYTAYPLAIGFGLGHHFGTVFRLTGQGLSLFFLAFACAWCARRIGNGEDRSGA